MLCVVRVLGRGWGFWAAGVGDEFVEVWVGGLVVGGEVAGEVVGAHGDHFEDVFPVFAGEAARDALEELGWRVAVVEVHHGGTEGRRGVGIYACGVCVCGW